MGLPSLALMDLPARPVLPVRQAKEDLPARQANKDRLDLRARKANKGRPGLLGLQARKANRGRRGQKVSGGLQGLRANKDRLARQESAGLPGLPVNRGLPAPRARKASSGEARGAKRPSTLSMMLSSGMAPRISASRLTSTGHRRTRPIGSSWPSGGQETSPGLLPPPTER